MSTARRKREKRKRKKEQEKANEAENRILKRINKRLLSAQSCGRGTTFQSLDTEQRLHLLFSTFSCPRVLLPLNLALPQTASAVSTTCAACARQLRKLARLGTRANSRTEIPSRPFANNYRKGELGISADKIREKLENFFTWTGALVRFLDKVRCR